MERIRKPVEGQPPEREDDTVSEGKRIPGGGTGMPPDSDVSDVGRTGPAGGERAPGGGVRLGTSIGDTGTRSSGGAPAREWPLRSDQRK